MEINKKGFLPAVSITLTVGTLIVIGLILVAVMIGFGVLLNFIITNIFAVLGVILLIFSLILLSKKAINQKFGGILIILSILLILLQFSGVTQSILGTSLITTTDGKQAWVVNMVADNVDEGFIFSYKPTNVTLANGDILSPKNSLTLKFTKQQGQCTYYITKESYKKLLITVDSYYVISSTPTRIAKVKITDNNGNSQIVDALSSSAITFTDTDGSGKIIVKPTTTGVSSKDCYSSQDIVIKEIKGQIKYFDKAEYISRLDSIYKYNYLDPTSIINAVINLFSSLSQDTAFINSFNSGSLILSSDYSKLTGDVNLGSPGFVITADQDVFESVLYEKPKVPTPDITCSIPKLEVGKSSSFKATVTNKLSDTSGIVKITSTTSNCNIEPLSTEITLKDSAIINYRIISNVEGTCKVTLKACASSQFEVKCDSTTCSAPVEKTTILNPITTNVCGNGICESNEAYSTCPSDCEGQSIMPTPINENATICEDKLFGLIPASITTTSKCEWYNLLCNTGITKPTQVSECKYDYGLFILIIGGIIVVVAMVLLIKPNKSTSKIKYVYRRRK